MKAPSQPMEMPESKVAVAPSAPSGWMPTLLRAIPTLAVLAILGGIGLWGHSNHWTLPKFSTLIGQGSSADADWCSAHNVPESECVSCNASLMPKSDLTGWCSVHGVHECVLEHPELAQLETPTTPVPADFDRAQRALQLRERAKNNQQCNNHLRRIQFASNQAALRAGIDCEEVSRGPVVETISASGKITFDETQVAHLSSRVAGTVWRAEKKVGDRVEEGDILLLVDAALVGQTKGEFLQALVQSRYHKQKYERLANLIEGVVAGREIQEALMAMQNAEVRLLSARQALINLGLPVKAEDYEGLSDLEMTRRIQFLGLPSALVEQLDPANTTANLLPVTAPLAGVVIERDVVAGEVVSSEKTLFMLANPSKMWLTLHVHLEDVQSIAIGQTVHFQPDGQPYESTGSVSWISSAVDRSTRTVQVRAELANEEGLLRDAIFGTGEIIIREEEEAILVPATAIHWEGCCHIAFVRDTNYFDGYKVFHARSVRPGVSDGDTTEVIAGLLPGEEIVHLGSAALRSEILKGNLGAG